METRIKMLKGVTVDRKAKFERYEDDYQREGHRVERVCSKFSKYVLLQVADSV